MLRAERVRYERTLTSLRDEAQYRAGVANAAELDPFSAVAAILRH
jgi:hypothetical protein